jgi:hypothetical protein
MNTELQNPESSPYTPAEDGKHTTALHKVTTCHGFTDTDNSLIPNA